MAWMRAPLMLALLVACGGGGGDGRDPPGPQDGGATGDGGAGDGGAASRERECEDGADNDGDGDADCADADCAENWTCNLPTAMDFDSRITFDGYTIECEYYGFEVDVDIEDCQANATAALEQVTSGRLCESCDRTYAGSFSYTTETCSALIGVPAPTRAEYGFVFVDPRTRELWTPDSAGVWAYTETLSSTDGRTFRLQGAEDIWEDPDDCDNGMQNLGRLSVNLTWTDR